MSVTMIESFLLSACTNQVKTDQGLVDIETGLMSLDEVQILSGIDSATLLYTPVE